MGDLGSPPRALRGAHLEKTLHAEPTSGRFPASRPRCPPGRALHGCTVPGQQHLKLPAPHMSLSAPHSLHPEFSHRKMDKTHTFSSVHLPHIQYKRGFSQLVQRFVPEQVSPVCRKASKAVLALAFLPLVMLRVLLHFIYIYIFLQHIFFHLNHTLKFGSSWISYILSKSIFSSEKRFCRKALPDSAGRLPACIHSIIC